jgi:hypothetical protein
MVASAKWKSKMSHDSAKIILDVVLRHCSEQNAALIEIQPKCTDDEFVEYKRMIGKSIGEMLLEVINPITKYPALRPREID